MNVYRVVVWCEACQDDEEGCFGGGSSLLKDDFYTREAAIEAAQSYCAKLPYRYRIEKLDVQNAWDLLAAGADRHADPRLTGAR